LETILEPAIRLAETGFIVHSISAQLWKQCESKLKNAANGQEWLMANQEAPQPGSLFKITQLGRVFRLLAKHGKDGFYKGDIASQIVDTVQSQGNL
jgi:gamma-glutamyltranspeptidase/glutathione hydrolase